MTAPLPRETWLASYADMLRQWLADGRFARLRLSGISMEPTIPPGARLVLAGCEPAAIRVADLVVYEDADRLICHRVLRRRRAQLLTKGDRLRVPAAWVAATSVIGRVVAIETDARPRRLSDLRERLRAQLATGRSWLVVLARSFVHTIR
jgi:hypothetical protein